MSNLFTSVRRWLLRVSSQGATSVRLAEAARPVRTWRILLIVLLSVEVMATGCTAAHRNLQELAQPAAFAQQAQPAQSLPPGQSPEGVALRPITQDLEWPLEILYGPDGFLWVTERVGKRVTRIDPETGDQSFALRISEAYQSESQDGLLGMVFHPELLQGTGNDYVYLAYTYLADAAAANTDSVTKRRVKIRRYTYDPEKKILGEPVDLLTNLPGSSDHNSGRLVFSPDGTLFYAIGDQGNNQFDRACLPILAQALPTAEEVKASDWSNYPGKILRLNLDGSIPDDNPLINGVQSHIYSYGHRNIQGLALGPDGHLYASEHGPKSDDEINLIQPDKNYGWPYVAGYQDDQGYVYANWSAAEDCPSLTFSDFEIPSSMPVQKESEWEDLNFVPPIYTFGTVTNDYDFQPEICAPLEYICWPTVAPTGLEVYDGSSGKVPGWPTSLLVTALKTGTVYRLALSEDGTTVAGEAVPLFKTTNRYRDLFIAPDSSAFYVITDSSGNTQGSFGLPTKALEHPGAILEFSYIGSN
jgi:PQQ-dependent dehydrogenase (s-GDH family)